MLHPPTLSHPRAVAVGALLAVFLCLAPPAEAQQNTVDIYHDGDTWFFQLGGAISFLSEVGTFEAVAGTVGYGGKIGHRWGDWGAFVSAEHNIWALTTIGEGAVDSVFNLGLGGEVLYYEQRVRTSLIVGTSTTLFDTILDEFGTTGAFLEVRPQGYRLPFDENVIVEINPLSFIVMVPIFEGIPLIQLSYRSTFSAEVRF